METPQPQEGRSDGKITMCMKSTIMDAHSYNFTIALKYITIIIYK